MRIVITANGAGERMKGLSQKPKHELYLGEKRIIEHLIGACEKVAPTFVLTSYRGDWQKNYPESVMLCEPAATRKETLSTIADWKDVLIIDCDVVFTALPAFDQSKDTVFYFESDCAKYAGLTMGEGKTLAGAEEKGPTQTMRASGAYFIKDVNALLQSMTDPDSIAGGMIGANMVKESNFIRVGDVEDYMKAI